MDIKRDFYLNKLIERKHDGFVKFITGIRRCGKSHLLNVQFRKHLRSQGIGDSQVIGLALDDDENGSLQAFVQIPKVCSELPMMMPKTIDKRWTRGMDITVQDKDLRRCVEKLFDELGANLLSEATGTRKKPDRLGGRGTRGASLTWCCETAFSVRIASCEFIGQLADGIQRDIDEFILRR